MNCLDENSYIGTVLYRCSMGVVRIIFSLNCIDWHLLQDPSEDSLTKSEVIRGRFIGDPSYEVNSLTLYP